MTIWQCSHNSCSSISDNVQALKSVWFIGDRFLAESYDTLQEFKADRLASHHGLP